MGFLIDFLCLVLLFDFCNVDFIVDGPDGAGKRKDRQKQRKEKRDGQWHRQKETYKEDGRGGWGMGREKEQNRTVKPEWEKEEEKRGESRGIKAGEAVIIISICQVGK